MGPQNHHDETHPNTMIKDLSVFLDNTQDATHCVAIFGGTRGLITHKSCNTMYISDEQLHAMELCISDGIRVQVESLEGERISQMC